MDNNNNRQYTEHPPQEWDDELPEYRTRRKFRGRDSQAYPRRRNGLATDYLNDPDYNTAVEQRNRRPRRPLNNEPYADYEYTQRRGTGWEGYYGPNYDYDAHAGRPDVFSSGQGSSGDYGYQGDWRSGEMPPPTGGRYYGDQSFQQIPIRHEGKGPKGWERSDDRIYEDVCEALARRRDIDPSDVEVKVEDGEVILEGTVDDWWMKRNMEDVAFAIYGVHDVQNRVRYVRNTET